MVTGDRIVRAPSVSSAIRKLAGLRLGRSVPCSPAENRLNQCSPGQRAASLICVSRRISTAARPLTRASTQAPFVPLGPLVARGGPPGRFRSRGGCRGNPDAGRGLPGKWPLLNGRGEATLATLHADAPL